jgi:hypothetical protein
VNIQESFSEIIAALANVRETFLQRVVNFSDLFAMYDAPQNFELPQFWSRLTASD